MRSVARLGLALLGLVLALPEVSWAGACPSCDALPANQKVRGGRYRQLCPNCQLQKALREAGPGPVVIENTGGPSLLPPPAPGEAIPGCATCAAAGEAPGYASLGGPTVLSLEPAPIGVVRAGFQPGMPAGPVPAQASSPSSWHGASTLVPPAPTGWVPQRSRRPSVLAHLFGLDGLGQRRQARAEWQARQHAAIPLGQPGAGPMPSEVPASFVYGSGGR